MVVCVVSLHGGQKGLTSDTQRECDGPGMMLGFESASQDWCATPDSTVTKKCKELLSVSVKVQRAHMCKHTEGVE